MLRLVSFFFILVTTHQAFASTQVEFVVSKVHGLVVFVEALSDFPHRESYFKKIFIESPFHTKKSLEHVEKFKSLENAVYRGVNFNGFPKSRHAGFQVHQILLTQSSYSNNLEEFKIRTLGTLSFDETLDYFKVLSYFEPIYDQLVWRTHYKSMLNYKKILEDRSKKWKLSARFQQAHVFYNANWPKTLNFRVALYPIPEGARSSSAESLGTFESLGLIQGDMDIPSIFGVLFHELCHSLYESQPQLFQHQLEKMFFDSNSEYWRLGYNYLNEVLATTLGNGWVYESAAGKLDSSSWYNDPVIDKMAKQILPTVKSYLNHGKSIDPSFVEKYLGLFERNFPKTIHQPNQLLSSVHLVTDNQDTKEEAARLAFKKVFTPRSLFTTAGFNQEETVRYLTQTKDRYTVAVLARTQLHQLKEVAELAPELFPNVKDIMATKGSGIYRFNQHKNPILVLVVDKNMPLINLFEGLKNLPTIEPGRWYPVAIKPPG